MKDVTHVSDIQHEVEADYLAGGNVFDFNVPPTVRRRIELELLTFGEVRVSLSPEFGRTEYDLREALDIVLDAVATLREMIREVRNEEDERDMNKR